nr:hypothetical protein [Tanacetum cinerariifolium]
MTILAEFIIIAGANNRPPMLDKSMYEYWKSHMELYIKNKENKRIILNSVQYGSLVWPIVAQEDDSGLVVHVFTQEDDPIACLKKAMAFLSAIAASRFPLTNNQLRTSSNLRNQATIQDDREGNQGLLNVIIFKVKDTWLGNALILRGQGTLHDPGILDGQAAQKTIPYNVAFQTEELDAYDSDYVGVSTSQAIRMANISNYCLVVIL